MKKVTILFITTLVISLLLLSCDEKNQTDPEDTEPPTVVITYPANNSEFVQGTIINITADATDNEEVKEVRFYIDGSFASLDEEEPYEYEWDTGNTRDTYHTIYAKAYDINDNTKSSEVINITLTEPVGSPPNPPSSPNPANNATSVSTNTNLSWTCTDPDGDPLTYDIYFGTSSNPPLVNSGQSGTTYDPGTLNEGTTYYWQIIAHDDHSNSTTGNVWEFTTHNGGTPAEMVFVQGGTFDMGDHYDEGGSNELPVHSVTLDDYYIGETEVTHQQVIDVFNWAYSQGYINCTSSTVTNNQGDSQELLDLDDGDCAIDWNGSSLEFVGSDKAPTADCPCIEITWYGSVAYCNYKSLQEGLDTCYDLSDWSCDFDANGYRLPTEAEWEYSARGGVNWTDDYRYSGCHNEADLPDYAWYRTNSNNQTHPVGTKLPNQLAIYDMSGNVWDWCNDWFDNNYYSSSPPNNPTGPTSGSYRVLRGNAWDGQADYCRVADRGSESPYGGGRHMGFRILRANLD